VNTVSNPIKAAIIIIVVIIIVGLGFFLIGDDDEEIVGDKPPFITEEVLDILEEQNTANRLEYAESQPIIKSMKEHLYHFDEYMQFNIPRAKGHLTVIRRRLEYLRVKGLDISGAEEIINQQVKNYIEKQPRK
jgi:hypothetical protein